MRSEGLHFRNVRMKGEVFFPVHRKFRFRELPVRYQGRFLACEERNRARQRGSKANIWPGTAKNVTFENCRIIGTQPLCYCRGLKLIDCEMIDTDLAFERSEVEASITTPVISIKNPLSGHITVPSRRGNHRDIQGADGTVEFRSRMGKQPAHDGLKGNERRADPSGEQAVFPHPGGRILLFPQQGDSGTGGRSDP